MDDVGCWSQVSSPLPPVSHPKPSCLRLRPGLWSGGRSQRPGCRGGQGQCPRWTSTAHTPPGSPISFQRGPLAPPALRGLCVAPHTLIGLGQVQQHHHLALCGHRWDSSVGCPGQGAGGGNPVGRCHPGHKQLWKRSPLCPRLGLWSIFWATWASWSFALGAPHLHSLLRRPGQARSEGHEVHPGGLLHLPTCRRGLSSQLPPRGGGLLCPLKQGPCWST